MDIKMGVNPVSELDRTMFQKQDSLREGTADPTPTANRYTHTTSPPLLHLQTSKTLTTPYNLLVTQ